MGYNYTVTAISVTLEQIMVIMKIEMVMACLEWPGFSCEINR